MPCIPHPRIRPCYYHYIKIIVVCVSVMGGHRKQFDPTTQGTVSLAVECQKVVDSVFRFLPSQVSEERWRVK